MTNNIFARTSNQNRTSSVKSNRSRTAETAGSLASRPTKTLLSTDSYDMVAFNSPYSLTIDYSNYANNEFATTSDSGFLSNFANAVAILGTDGAGFIGCSDGGASCGGSSSGGGSCGGFTSFV